MWCCGSLVKTDSSMCGRVRIRETEEEWRPLLGDTKSVCLLRYSVVWPNISTKMGTVVSRLECGTRVYIDVVNICPTF